MHNGGNKEPLKLFLSKNIQKETASVSPRLAKLSSKNESAHREAVPLFGFNIIGFIFRAMLKQLQKNKREAQAGPMEPETTSHC